MSFTYEVLSFLMSSCAFFSFFLFFVSSVSMQLQQSENSDTFSRMIASYFGVCSTHRTLTWTTGSLTRVCDFCFCPLHAYTHGGPRFIVGLIQRTFAESAQNLTAAKSRSGCSGHRIIVVTTFDRASLDFREKCAWYAPSILSLR